jgi:hypothetical protein
MYMETRNAYNILAEKHECKAQPGELYVDGIYYYYNIWSLQNRVLGCELNLCGSSEVRLWIL